MPASHATALVPPLAFPEIPEDKTSAAQIWYQYFWQARRDAQLASMNFAIQMPTHFNPEYYLERWTATILDSERLRQDVWGWALTTLELEQEHAMGHPPHSDDMLKESQSGYFLLRFKEWAEARLAYHRLALRLTFYKADPLANKEPIASDVVRLRARLGDWRDVQLEERRRLFESDPKISPWLQSLKDGEHFRKEEVRALEFKQWLHKNGLKNRVISWEAIEWLCWLHLIAPISRAWELHEIGVAIRKTFATPDYAKDAKDWWDNPPQRLTYEPVDETDGFAESVIKRAFSQEFQEWRAGWIADSLKEVAGFTDTLRKQLNDVGFDYNAKRGRPKKQKANVIPEAWDALPSGDIEQALNNFVAIISREERPEDEFKPTDAKEEMEKDEPEGWLLANRIKV